MALINKPNTFSANTTISASGVNANFDTVYNEVNGALSAANLATDAVTTAKITDSNVTTAKVADSAITTAKINDGAVTTDKIAADAVTAPKIAGIRLFDVNSSNTGGVPPDEATTLFKIQTGTSVASFSSNYITVTFPTAFPNGVVSVVATNGDHSVNGVAINTDNIALDTFRAYAVGGASGSVRVNWIAIGW